MGALMLSPTTTLRRGAETAPPRSEPIDTDAVLVDRTGARDDRTTGPAGPGGSAGPGDREPAAGPRTSTTDGPRGRDGFLDALRAIAIVRVVVWHAFGAPIMSWVVATMPLMFFVAGSLLARSLDARPARVVLRARLRRLLVPFWLFGACVLGFLSFTHLLEPTAATRVSPDQVWAWALPLVDPTASSWEAGWASSPLWYLRAYLWLLLLSPLLLAAWRRIGLAVLPGLLAILVAAQIVADTVQAGAHHPIWIVGDIGIYGLFLVVGFAHADGAFASLCVRDLLEWIVVAVASTVVAWRLFPADDGVVNHSYPALFTSGVGWLAVALLCRPLLSRTPDVRFVGPVLFWMTRRAMSIYLWHSPAIVAAYALIAHLGARPTPTLVLVLVAVFVVMAVTATGWIEDVAGGRPGEIWPTRTAAPLTLDATLGRFVPRSTRATAASVLAGSVAALVVVGSVVPVSAATPGDSVSSGTADAGGALGLPPAPSGRPDPTAGTTGDASSTSPATSATDGRATTSLVTASAESSGDLDEVVASWRSAAGIAGVAVEAVLADGRRVVATAGDAGDGVAMTTGSVVPVTSVTKSVTAAIVMQLVDEGMVDLDAPMTSIPGAGPVPNGRSITVRQLLDHSSGIAPYQETPTYDASAALDPVGAVRASLGTDLQWEPGTRSGYSNSGFLALGLIIESVTGLSYEENLRTRIIEPYGLTSTSLDDTPTAGWVGWSAGGLVSSVDDLATWGRALFAEGRVVSPESLAEMTSVRETLMSGLGTFPVCPCAPVGDGTLATTSVGHNGGSVTVQYAAADGLVVAASFSESFWTSELDQADVYDLIARVSRTVAGS